MPQGLYQEIPFDTDTAYWFHGGSNTNHTTKIDRLSRYLLFLHKGPSWRVATTQLEQIFWGNIMNEASSFSTIILQTHRWVCHPCVLPGGFFKDSYVQFSSVRPLGGLLQYPQRCPHFIAKFLHIVCYLFTWWITNKFLWNSHIFTENSFKDIYRSQLSISWDIWQRTPHHWQIIMHEYFLVGICLYLLQRIMCPWRRHYQFCGIVTFYRWC